MRRSRWVVGVICIGCIAGGYWYFFGGSSESANASVTLTPVTKGSIKTSVKATGKISPIQTTTLSFSKQGTISKIQKQVGDTVKAGDVIAEIDATSAYLDIENARISLQNAQNNYNKLFTSTTESDKIRAKNTYEESISTLENLERIYRDLVTTQKNARDDATANITLLEEKVKLAESELEYAKKNIDTDTTSNNLEKDIANAYVSLENIQKGLASTLKTYKESLWIDSMSDPRYSDLGGRDTYSKSQAENLYKTISGTLLSFNIELGNLRSSSPRTFDDTLSVVKSGQSLLSDMSRLGGLITTVYDNSIESSNLQSDYITSQKSTIKNLSSEISNSLTSMNNTLATLKNYGDSDLEALADKNTVTTKEQSLQNAKNELRKAKATYDSLLQSQETEKEQKSDEITKQKNTIALNNATYKELLEGPVNADRVSAQNSIASAKISLEKAELSLEDYQIIASFDGVINDIPWRVGDTTLSTEGILVENKDAYEIALSLDQIDIVKVKPGMRANITLDAFPGETYTGSITRVSEVPTETSGVVSYEAVIGLTLDRDDVYSKMTTSVEIIVTEKSDIITIPSSAINTTNGKSSVEVVKNTKNIPTPNTANLTLGGSGNRIVSGERGFPGSRSFSGGVRTTGMRGAQSTTSTSDVETEKRGIVIGATSGDKTEIISGLEVGEVVVTRKIGASSQGTTTSSSANRNSGFGGRPPGF